MPKFVVDIHYEIGASIIIEADNKEHAKRIIENELDENGIDNLDERLDYNHRGWDVLDCEQVKGT